MELSLPGLIGAAIGLVLALINYGVIVTFVEQRLRALDDSKTDAERAVFERKIQIMRQTILWLDIVVFAALGYWFGQTLGG